MHPNRILDFSGQVVAITGAARGIGQATALAFAQAGAHVALLDIDGAAAQEAAQQIKADCGHSATRIEGMALDVTQARDVALVVDRVAAWNGRLDVMVNNAGIALRKPTLELSLADWNKVVEVNLTGVFLCAQAAGRHMVAAGRGCIVNTASIMGLSGGGLYPNISYQSTKGAVVNLTRALAVEWAPHQVRVNAVAPTWVRTEFIRPLLGQPDLVQRIEGMTPLGRLAEADDIVAAILYLASPAASMVTGHTLPVDGGFLAQ
jgi:NAD(P)-dependent dehydrogenase (short-subunit alcohol dehydrogenase family)